MNRPPHPLNLWRFYNDRAGVELLIKQLKGDDAMGSIPTRHCFANETSFQLLVLAYNLITWFTRIRLPPEFQRATFQTLRHEILLMPAQLRQPIIAPGWHCWPVVAREKRPAVCPAEDCEAQGLTGPFFTPDSGLYKKGI